MKKVVLITGASNGMGFEAAKLFAEKGYSVVAGARRMEKIPADKNISAVKLDVSDVSSNEAFVQFALQKFGRIDVLINNAGYGEYGPTEEISYSNALYQFKVNYFAAVNLAQLVLPTMRKQHSGRIVNISSTGGNGYVPLGAHYHASKAALQQWSDVLDTEVSQFGIRSVIVQPGGTQSAWSEIAMKNAKENLKPDSPYKKLVEGIGNMLNNINLGATSKELAEIFYQAATDAKPKFRYYYSLRDRMMVWTARNHPRITHFGMNQLVKGLLKK
ncbi:MAG: SDR family NAD(P)-dependent oxidoreductase [Enterococcus hulanensis]